MPGVGNTPTSRTSIPADARPAATAALRNWPEMRVSRPITARGRWPENSPRSARTWAAATARSTASSAVMSRFATPRTPSVPNSRAMRGTLALRVLRRAAGLLETSLLALHDASVAGQEACLLERRAVVVLVDAVEGTGHAETQRAGLTGGAATLDAGVNVEATLDVEQRERRVHELLVHLVG